MLRTTLNLAFALVVIAAACSTKKGSVSTTHESLASPVDGAASGNPSEASSAGDSSHAAVADSMPIDSTSLDVEPEVFAVRDSSNETLAEWLVNQTTSPKVPEMNDAGFARWLSALRREAGERGIRPATLDAAFVDVEPLPRVLELDRKQPEFTMTFDEYVARVASDERVAEGRRLLSVHRALLDSVEARSGVPKEMVVSLWGIESSFGTKLGTFRVIPALATLAYDGRRSKFFRGELIHALEILDGGHITPDQMIGSWAGAMGQCQFMPSSFVNFAVDQDEDGRADIWSNVADVFGSAANYLSKSGWERGHPWGCEVTLPKRFDASRLGTNVRKTAAQWQALGVRRRGGGELPSPELIGSIVKPEEGGRRAFLVFSNFEVIMRWNRSTFFATTAGLLADRIAAREPR